MECAILEGGTFVWVYLPTLVVVEAIVIGTVWTRVPVHGVHEAELDLLDLTVLRVWNSQAATNDRPSVTVRKGVGW